MRNRSRRGVSAPANSRADHDETHSIISYELWNRQTMNLYGSYPSRREALRAARVIAEEHGPEYASEFVLAAEDAQGKTIRIAEGTELVRLAHVEGASQSAAQDRPSERAGAA